MAFDSFLYLGENSTNWEIGNIVVTVLLIVSGIGSYLIVMSKEYYKNSHLFRSFTHNQSFIFHYIRDYEELRRYEEEEIEKDKEIFEKLEKKEQSNWFVLNWKWLTYAFRMKLESICVFMVLFLPFVMNPFHEMLNYIFHNELNNYFKNITNHHYCQIVSDPIIGIKQLQYIYDMIYNCWVFFLWLFFLSFLSFKGELNIDKVDIKFVSNFIKCSLKKSIKISFLYWGIQLIIFSFKISSQSYPTCFCYLNLIESYKNSENNAAQANIISNNRFPKCDKLFMLDISLFMTRNLFLALQFLDLFENTEFKPAAEQNNTYIELEMSHELINTLMKEMVSKNDIERIYLSSLKEAITLTGEKGFKKCLKRKFRKDLNEILKKCTSKLKTIVLKRKVPKKKLILRKRQGTKPNYYYILYYTAAVDVFLSVVIGILFYISLIYLEKIEDSYLNNATISADHIFPNSEIDLLYSYVYSITVFHKIIYVISCFCNFIESSVIAILLFYVFKAKNILGLKEYELRKLKHHVIQR